MGFPLLGITAAALIIALGATIFFGGNFAQDYLLELPEQHLGRLIVSYHTIDRSIKSTLDNNAGAIFEKAADRPLDWSGLENKGSQEAVGEIIEMYRLSLEGAAQEYFNSVSYVGSDVQEVVSVGSILELDGEGMKWEYRYKIGLQNTYSWDMHQGLIRNTINSEESHEIQFEFLDLEKAHLCAKSFFREAGKGINIEGVERLKAKQYTDRALNEYAAEVSGTVNCAGFSIESRVITLPSCISDLCGNEGWDNADVALIIRKTYSANRASIAFKNSMGLFKGGGKRLISCQTGLDCMGSGTGELDCIGGFCASCLGQFEGAACSPYGQGTPLGNSQCYKYLRDLSSGAFEGYKCLPSKEGIRISDGERFYSDGEAISVNCASKEKKIRLVSASKDDLDRDYTKLSKAYFNGIIFSPSGAGDSLGEYYDVCLQRDFPRVSGRFEVYLKDSLGGDLYYRAALAYLDYSIDGCISKLNSRLIGFTHNFDKTSCAGLYREANLSINRAIRSVNCPGYHVGIMEAPALSNCIIECGSVSLGDCAKETAWESELYSAYLIGIWKEGNVMERETALATSGYILNYSP